MMNERFQQKPAAVPSFHPVPGAVMRRKCACGCTPGPTGECEAFRRKKLQRRRGNLAGPSANDLPSSVSDVPPIVHEVLRSPGQPLDAGTRSFFEPRFGHDFGHVRVHVDGLAASSAEKVNSLAYTFGRNIVFGAGQYCPETQPGRQLLAHELTHVVQQSLPRQQSVSSANHSAEKEANRAAEFLGQNLQPIREQVPAAALQRQAPPQQQSPPPRQLDATAQEIIAIAQDAQRNLQFRAIQVVYRILSAYFPADAPNIAGVGFDAGQPGLQTTLSGSGGNTRATITVGRYFVENTEPLHFARRVLQVGHEIQHINDWRAGMAGSRRSDEREFRAFHQAAVTREIAGTGRMQHSDRVNQIDAALGYWNCLDSGLQQQYANQHQELLTRRTEEIRRSGQTFGPVPSSCVRASN
jgi:hypothetical protein